jgi:hypothetical protein
MLTLSELFECVSFDDAARVLPNLFSWPRTSTVRHLDSACLTVSQENLNLEGVVRVASTDVELHASGRRDAVTLLRLLAVHRYDLMMLTKVDNLLVYQNGTLAVRVVLNETQTGRSASIDVAQVRMTFEMVAKKSAIPYFVGTLGVVLLLMYAAFSM